MKNYITLDEVGIINSPEAIIEAIIQSFKATDPYQSKLFPVASLMGILALHKGRDNEIVSETEIALSRVFTAYFGDDFTLDVSLKDNDDNSSSLTIAASVSGPDGLVDASWALTITEDSTGNPRTISAEKVSYDI